MGFLEEPELEAARTESLWGENPAIITADETIDDSTDFFEDEFVEDLPQASQNPAPKETTGAL
jgi:hypothetical protein